jgi:uncharacterized metal-binding protein YceD (DUF177 family)
MARAVTKETATHHEPATHGFRRTVSVAKIGEAGLVQTITATPADAEKVAAYLGLQAVKTLSADVTFARWRAKGVRVTGVLKADVVQSCVVTLDPVDAHIEAPFERRFLPDETRDADEPDVFVDPEGEDPAEPLGREIDVGEILVEELSLNLDPYPRKVGVAFEGADDEGATPARANPFAALAKLKRKLEKK